MSLDKFGYEATQLNGMNTSHHVIDVEGRMLNDDVCGHSAYQVGIGRFRTAYYLRAFKNSGSDINIGWNWAGFLFTAFWCVYRKMYGAALTISAIFIGFPIYLIDHPEMIAKGLVLLIVLWISCGLFGTSLYRHHIEALIQKAGLHSSARDQQWAYLQRKGGTNPWAVLPAMLIWVMAASAADNYAASKAKPPPLPAVSPSSNYSRQVEPQSPQQNSISPTQRSYSSPNEDSPTLQHPNYSAGSAHAPQLQRRKATLDDASREQTAALHDARQRLFSRYPYLATDEGMFVREEIEEEAARLQAKGATPARALERAADMIAPYRFPRALQ